MERPDVLSALPPKMTNRINIVPAKMPTALFCVCVEMDRPSLKWMWKCKGPERLRQF